MEEAVVVSNGSVSDSSSVHKIRSIRRWLFPMAVSRTPLLFIRSDPLYALPFSKMEEAVVVSNGRVSDSSSVHKFPSIIVGFLLVLWRSTGCHFKAGGRKVLLNVVPDV